jgi:TRAP-type C4-dicarboxylate transport system permease small subunit
VKALLIRTDRWLARVDVAMVSVAALMVLFMMGVTAFDVFMRYVMNAPLTWAYDLITQYLLIASFFFAFSYTLKTNENIAVDFFTRFLNPHWREAAMGVGHLLAAGIFLVVVFLSGKDTYEAWKNNEAMMGALVLPTWSMKAIVPVGALSLAVRLVHRGLCHLAAMRDERFGQAVGLPRPGIALQEAV